MNLAPDFPIGSILKWLEQNEPELVNILPKSDVPVRFASHWAVHDIFRALQQKRPGQPVGLMLGAHGTLAELGLDGQIAQHCSSLRQAHQMYLHYRSMSRPGHVRLESDPDQQTDSLVVNPFFHEDLVESDESRLVFPLALGLNMFREMLGEPRLNVHSLHLMVPDDRFRAEYEEYFGGEIHFNSPDCRLVFHSADFDRPIRAAVPETRPFLEQLALSQKSHVSACKGSSDNFIEMVQEELRKAILSEDFEQTTIARRMSIGPRTLQRRLKEHDLTFRALTESVQERLAMDFLLNTELSVQEIAYKIGYQQPASFHRAFKRWTGQSPSTVRADRAENKP